MKVVITETKETHTLTLTCPHTGVDYTRDFIGNASGFTNNDFVRFDELSEKEQLEFAEFGEDYYYATQDAFDWWQPVIENTTKTDALIKEHGDTLTDDIKKELHLACDNDIEATAIARLAIMTIATGKVGLVEEREVRKAYRIKGDTLAVYVSAHFDVTDDNGCESATFDATLEATYSWDDDEEHIVLPALEQQLTHLENLTEEQESFVLNTLQDFVYADLLIAS